MAIKFSFFRNGTVPYNRGSIIGCAVKFDFINHAGVKDTRIYVYKQDNGALLRVDATRAEGCPTQLPVIYIADFRMFGSDDYRRKLLRRAVFRDEKFLSKIISIQNYSNLSRSDLNMVYANTPSTIFPRIEEMVRMGAINSHQEGV